MALPNPLDFVWHQRFSWAAVMAAQRHFTACLIQMGVWSDRLRNQLPENGCDIEYADTERITSIPLDCRVDVLSFVSSKPKVVLQLRRAYPKLVCRPTLQMRPIVHAPGMALPAISGCIFPRSDVRCAYASFVRPTPLQQRRRHLQYVIARARKAGSSSDHVSDA